MDKIAMRIAVRNLVWLALVALPVLFLLAWMQSIVSGAEGRWNLGYVAETGGFYYLAYAPYVLLGGIAHQALVMVIPSAWDGSPRRAIALLLTPVIAVPVAFVGDDLRTIGEFLIPVLAALVTYGVVMRLPENPSV